MPPGWAVIALVLILESCIMSKYLTGKWNSGMIWLSAILSNLVSGAAGVLLSLAHNGGWWLVCWFPWVSRNEVHFSSIGFFILYFAIAVILSIVIEWGMNLLVLHKKYSAGRIAVGNLFANAVSNALVITVMYIVSFVFL